MGKRDKCILLLHTVLVVLELFAAVHMISNEGLSVLRYYTVDSNMLQLLVSAGYLACFIGKKEVPAALTVMHLVASVCLTVTFLIAAFVLMPQSTFAYYFLDDVAPINHFIGPLLSVTTLMLSDKKIPRPAVIAPAAATVIYGIILLILNAARVVTGPYFFLEIYSTPIATIIMWFAIIIILCVALTAAYMYIHSRVLRTFPDPE